MLQVIYNGKNISADIEIALLDVTDNCGDQMDAIDAMFANTKDQWSAWNPQKGDTLEITMDGYKSGVMWIDRIKQESGRIALGAVSVPPAAKTERTKSWENVTLLTLASEKAANYQMAAQFFGVQSYTYGRVDQVSRKDFGFLQERAKYEGCTMKIDSGKVVVYSDLFMEKQPAVKRIDPSMFYGDPVFNQSAQKTFRSCTVSWKSISGTFEDPECIGSDLLVSDVPVTSLGEAQRFAKNMLRSYNKRETYGEISTTLDVTITGGNVIEIAGMGMSDGRYFVQEARHSFADHISSYKLHRCLERY